MKHKRIAMSLVMATLMLVSIFAVTSSSTVSVSAADSGGKPLVQQSNDGIVGAPLGSGPAACSWAANREDIFAQNASHAIWHTWYDGNWHNWESLGGIATSDPGAVAWAVNNMAVFVRGGDGALWGKYYQNGWSNWQYIGGQLAPGTGPAACAMSTERFDLFVTGTDHALYQKTWSSGYGTWKNVGGVLTASPAAASSSANTIDVFVRGGDGALWSRQYQTSTGWTASKWYSLGGRFAPGTGPGAAQIPGGKLYVFIIGTDNAVWYKERIGGSWNGWYYAGGASTSSVAATYFADSLSSYINIFIRGTNGHCWMRAYWWGYYYTGWSSFVDLGSPTN